MPFLILMISFIRSFSLFSLLETIDILLEFRRTLISLPIMPLITDGFNFNSNAYELIRTILYMHGPTTANQISITSIIAQCRLIHLSLYVEPHIKLDHNPGSIYDLLLTN